MQRGLGCVKFMLEDSGGVTGDVESSAAIAVDTIPRMRQGTKTTPPVAILTVLKTEN